MKTLFSLAIAIFIGSFTLQAQTAADTEREAKLRTEQLAKALDLDEDQQVLVYRQNYEIIDNAQRMKNMKSSEEEKAEMNKAYMKRFDDTMKKILSEEQFAQYLQIKDDKKDNVRERTKK